MRLSHLAGEIWNCSEHYTNKLTVKVQFTRELDSLNEIGIVDAASFTAQPDGTDLEEGEMPHPDLPGNPMTAFEEVWQELPFREGPEGAKKGISWILESDDGDVDLGEKEEAGREVTLTKMFFGRVWGTYLAFRQVQTHSREQGSWIVKRAGAEVSARREDWGSSGWEEKYVVGPDAGAVFSMKDGFEGEGKGAWRIPGEKVVIQGKSFLVRAFEEIE